jgi:hypothetical protein
MWRVGYIQVEEEVVRKMVSTLQHWRVASALLFAESRCNAWALMQALTVMVAASKRAALRAVNKLVLPPLVQIQPAH